MTNPFYSSDSCVEVDFRTETQKAVPVAQEWSDITIFLDRSGSMSSFGNGVIESINGFIKATVGDGLGNLRWSMVLFDDPYSAKGAKEEFPQVLFEESRDAVPSMEPKDFHPRGGTALVDALCISLQRAKHRVGNIPDAQKPAKVIYVIVTDGGENSSKEWTSDKLREMMADLQSSHRFEFVYIGANQDAFAVAHGIGVSQTMANCGLAAGYSNSFNYDPTAGGLFQGVASGCVGMAAIMSGSVALGSIGMMAVSGRQDIKGGVVPDESWKVYV